MEAGLPGRTGVSDGDFHVTVTERRRATQAPSLTSFCYTPPLDTMPYALLYGHVTRRERGSPLFSG